MSTGAWDSTIMHTLRQILELLREILMELRRRNNG